MPFNYEDKNKAGYNSLKVQLEATQEKNLIMTKTSAAAGKRQKRTHSHKVDVTQPKVRGIELDTQGAHGVLSPHSG